MQLITIGVEVPVDRKCPAPERHRGNNFSHLYPARTTNMTHQKKMGVSEGVRHLGPPLTPPQAGENHTNAHYELKCVTPNSL